MPSQGLRPVVPLCHKVGRCTQMCSGQGHWAEVQRWHQAATPSSPSAHFPAWGSNPKLPWVKSFRDLGVHTGETGPLKADLHRISPGKIPVPRTATEDRNRGREWATAGQHPSGSLVFRLWHQVWGVLTTWGASSDSSMGNLRSACPHRRSSRLQSGPKDRT